MSQTNLSKTGICIFSVSLFLNIGIASSQEKTRMIAGASHGSISHVAEHVTEKKETQAFVPHEAGTPVHNWTAQPFDFKIFVENKGQFNKATNKSRDKVLFEAHLGDIKAYFTPNGIVYRYQKSSLKNEKEKEEKEEKEREREREGKERDREREEKEIKFVRLNWVGCNEDVEIEARDEQSYYYTYPVGMDQTIEVKVYKKIIYKNLYPGIDVEYVFPEDKEGLKYNVILHPGANASLIKLKYQGADGITTNKEGDAIVKTEMNDFTDHAPVCYYEGGEPIGAHYKIDGNEESFEFDKPYDLSRTVIIDPWTTNPAYTGAYNQAYDIDYDDYGNVYTYGSWSPSQLVKFNSAGVIQWKFNATTINTDVNAQWGDFAVDKVTGRSYLAEGFNPSSAGGARALKISSAGALVATFAGNANLEEMDRVAYNICNHQLVIAGGGPSHTNQACMIDTSMVGFVPQNVLGANLPFHDMWLLAMDPDGNTCYMGSANSCCNNNAAYDDRLLKLNVPALTASTFNFNIRTAFGTWMPEGISNVNYMTWSGVPANGFNGLTCSKNFLFFYDGADMYKLNKTTGALIASRAGVSTSMQSWGGLDVDVCDNVFVGSNKKVFVYNGTTLAAGSVPTATISCSNTVYDVMLSKDYSMVYVGGEGFVSSFTSPVTPVTFTNSATNPACGSCNGSITANLYECGVAKTGTYVWSDGQTTQTAAGLCAGTYTVTVTPTGECRSYKSVITLSAAGALTPSITAAPATLCNGGSTTLTASGATTYTWSANAGSATTNTVSVGPGSTTTYTVTGTSGSCTGTQTISVTVSATPTVNISGTLTHCSGSAMTLTASTTAGTYTWSANAGGVSTSTVSVNPGAGTTTYTLTGSNGTCTASTVATVTVTTTPTLSVNSPSICSGSSVVLTASTNASTYTWSTSATTNTISVSPGVGTTTYNVTGDNGNGCTVLKTATVTVVAQPTVSISGGLSNCSGTPVVLTGSTTAGTFTWSANAGGVSTNTVSVNPGAGTTTYTLNASNGTCTASTVATLTTTQTPTLSVNSPSICSGSSVVLTASTNASTYTWSTSATTNTISVSPGVGTTTYNVTGDNGNGCTVLKTATVTVVAQPTVSISGGLSNCSGTPVVLTGSTTAGTFTWSANAGGTSTNTVSVNPGAGTTTYTLNASNGTCTATTVATLTTTQTPTLSVNSPSICSGASTILTAATNANTYTWSTTATTNTISVNPVATTTYNVIGDNGNGCTVTKTATVTVNSTPTVSISGTNNICSGTPVVLTASTAATYSWSTTATTNTISVSPSSNTTYTVTGANGPCTATAAITVTVTPTPTLSVNSPTICSGTNAILTASTNANTYTWSTTATTNTISVSPVTTTTYNVIGDNGNGCTVAQTATVTVNTTPTVSITGPSSGCSGNALFFTGGTATNYTWLPGGQNTSTITVTPSPGPTTYTLIGANGTCTASTTAMVDIAATPTLVTNNPTICSGQSTILSGSGANSFTWSANAGSANTNTVSVNPSSTTVYTLSGTSGTCTNVTTATVTVNTTPTLSLSANSYTICNGSSATFNASGATSYTWTTGTGLSCTSCSSPTATPSSTTIYTLTGDDGGSCLSAPETVTVTVNALPTLTLSPSSTSLCSSNSSTITANGATSYTWSPAGSLSSGTGSTVTATPTTTTDYTVSGTDANGCVNTETVSITVAPTPTMNISALPPTACAGQSVVLTASGATTYTWSSNAGSANTNTVSVTPVIATTYTVTGSIGSCTSGTVATVAVNALPVIGTHTVTDAACGQSNGCIDSVSVSGGAPGYQYSWDHGATWSNASQNCGLPFGSYTVEVIDQNGCKDSTTVSVSNLNGPSLPSVAATATTVCLGDSDSLSVTSPVATYTYTWSDATGIHTGTTYTLSYIGPSGNYNINITATDTNGCSSVTTVTLNVNQLPNTAVTGTTHFCKGTSTLLTANPNTGSTYQWSQNGVPISGATSPTYSAASAGVYNVLITDNSTGCKASATNDYTVTVDSLPKIDTSGMVITNTNCGTSTGSISSVTVTGTGATYSWTDQFGNVVGTSLNLGNVAAGQYCLHVTTNPDLCKDSICSLTVNSAGTPNTPVLNTPNNSYCQGQIQNPIVVTGTTTVNWYSDAGLTTQIATGTTYTPSVAVTTTVYVTATSSGCVSSVLPVVITINNNPTTPIVAAAPNPYCQGQTISPITATGAPTILWSTSSAMSPIVNTGSTFTPPSIVGTTTYYLQDTSSAGCKSGIDSVSVTINPTPADPILSATSGNYCQGQTISPITANGSATGTILWYDNVGLTPVINTGATYTPPATIGTFTYYVVDSSAAGCKSVGTVTATVTVNPTPADPTVPQPTYTYCQSQAIGAITASGTPTILWSTSPSMSPVINTGSTFTPPSILDTTTYYLQDTSAAGCRSAGIDSVKVIVYANPTVSGGTADTAKCGLANGSISGINVSGGNPGYHYQWYDSTAIMVNETGQTLTNVGPGTYSVLITDTNGCQAIGSVPVFTVAAIVQPSVTIMPSFTQGTAPVDVTFSCTTVGATSWNWDFGNGTGSNLQNPNQVSYTAPGTYSVILMASNSACSNQDTATVIVDSPVSIIIPNIYSPNGDGINDEFFITCVGIRDLHCDIFNRWGTLVYQLLAVDQKWDGVMINGNRASDGTYFYILDATGFDGKKYQSHGSLTLVK